MKQNKNITLTTFLLLFSSTLLLSQVEGIKLSKNHYREYGFESSNVLRYLSFTQEIANETNFSFVIRRHKKGNRGATRWIFDVNVFSNFGSDILSLSVNWGKEYHKKFNERWTGYSGFEFSINGRDVFFFNQGFDFTIGAAPILGMRFKLNSLVYLSTESSFDIRFGTGQRGLRGITLATTIPSILYVNFRFGSKKTFKK